MSRFIIRFGIATIVICSVLAVVIGNQSMRGGGRGLDEDAWRQGLRFFQDNESEKREVYRTLQESAWGCLCGSGFGRNQKSG